MFDSASYIGYSITTEAFYAPIMIKIVIRFSCFLSLLVAKEGFAQGCLLTNYDPFNKVFNVPTSTGSRTFVAGNGRNFVLWENVCGPHTYIQILSSPSGNCQVQGVSQVGTYYPVVSLPFTRTCALPIDDYIWGLMPVISGVVYAFRKKLFV